MMTLWCMMRSPLIVGAHLPKNDAFTLNLLTNKDVLDIQLFSHCAHQLNRSENSIIWIAPGKDGCGMYIAFFNIADNETTISLNLASCDMENAVSAKELWSHSNTCIKNGVLSYALPSHGAAVFLVR